MWNKGSNSVLDSSQRIGSGSLKQPKFAFYWETRVEPPTPPVGARFSTGADVDSKGVIHRIMQDTQRQVYFGYDVVVEVLPEPSTFRVTFKQPAPSSVVNRNLSSWTSLPAPAYPPPQKVHAGEILEVILLSNPGSNQKIADYISIQEPTVSVPLYQTSFVRPETREFSYATGAARDITPDDIALHISAPRLSINGKPEMVTNFRIDSAFGNFIWLYVPEHGRIIVSLGRHEKEGLKKLGEVRGTTLKFTIGADTYTLSSGSPMAPGQAAYNVYGVQQPNWKPTYPFADLSAFNIGAVNQLDALP